MKLGNAIKKLERAGFTVQRSGHTIFTRTPSRELSFMLNGREEDNYGIHCIRVRSLNDHDDTMRDYCAGSFYSNLTQAIRAMGR